MQECSYTTLVSLGNLEVGGKQILARGRGDINGLPQHLSENDLPVFAAVAPKLVMQKQLFLLLAVRSGLDPHCIDKKTVKHKNPGGTNWATKTAASGFLPLDCCWNGDANPGESRYVYLLMTSSSFDWATSLWVAVFFFAGACFLLATTSSPKKDDELLSDSPPMEAWK